MSEFLRAALSFPTVIFTTLLGVVSLYWVFVVLGFGGLHHRDVIGDRLDGDLVELVDCFDATSRLGFVESGVVRELDQGCSVVRATCAWRCATAR